jgi:site-specific recombinase XerD
MKNSSSLLAPILESFFIERLINQKQASQETVLAYRDTFRLLLKYAQRELGKLPSKLLLEDLNAPLICKFLNYLEEERHNTPRTRNHRLATIRSFFHYASFSEPQLSAHIQRVLAIPAKRYQKREIDFLTVAEVDAILDVIDRSSWIGRRDHTLISLAIHTGMRVSELINLSCSNVTVGGGSYVQCTGKGRKNRSMLLGKRVSKIIENWLGELDVKPSTPLFPNRQGTRLSRDTVAYILSKYVSRAEKHCPSLLKKRVSPHVLRHTAAVHLLQAGVDLSVIALWLGHESLESTQAYMNSDLSQKIKVLEKTLPISAEPLTFKPDDNLLEFLKTL